MPLMRLSLALALLALSTPRAQAVVPWTQLIACDGPSGQAVVDDFVFTYYGQPVFQQQLVVRNESINRWLYSQGVVIPEISGNFPQELVITLTRLSSDEHRKIPDTYQSTLGAFVYEVKIALPQVELHVYSRETGREQANWIFRECAALR